MPPCASIHHSAYKRQAKARGSRLTVPSSFPLTFPWLTRAHFLPDFALAVADCFKLAPKDSAVKAIQGLAA